MSRHPTVDPELPWGYWLRLESNNRGTFLMDEDGAAWTSFRDAFWCGRLRLQRVRDSFRDEILEALLAILVNVMRGRSSPGERALDILGGSRLLETLFQLWLQREGLCTSGCSDLPSVEEVTAEGRSAMLMLAATRPQPVSAIRATSTSVSQLIELGIGPSPAEERMSQTEEASRSWSAAFRRRTLGNRHTIVLEKRDVDTPLPHIRTVWTQTFDDQQSRDAMYEWLCVRVDRWPAWANLAWSESGSALTTKLMSLMMRSWSTLYPTD